MRAGETDRRGRSWGKSPGGMQSWRETGQRGGELGDRGDGDTEQEFGRPIKGTTARDSPRRYRGQRRGDRGGGETGEGNEEGTQRAGRGPKVGAGLQAVTDERRECAAGLWFSWRGGSRKRPSPGLRTGWACRQGAAPRWPSACPARGRQVGQGRSVGPPRPPRPPDKRPFFGRAGRRSRLFARLGKGAAPPTPPAPRGAAAGSWGWGACERRAASVSGGMCVREEVRVCAGGNRVRAAGSGVPRVQCVWTAG